MEIYNFNRSIIIQDPKDLSILNDLTAENEYTFNPSRYEYFIVKLVLLADYNLQNISVKTSALISDDDVIENAVTCLNTEGYNSFGKKFSSKISLIENVLQPIYIGVSFKKAKLQTYKTEVTIGNDKVALVFNLTDDLVFDEGFHDESSFSRLKWLNSKKSWSNDVIEGHKRIVCDDNKINILGHKLIVNSNGMLENSQSYYDNSNSLQNDVQKSLFYKPMSLEIEGKKLEFKECEISPKISYVNTKSESLIDNNKVVIESKVKYDGSIAYKINISTPDEFLISNLSLKMFFKSSSFFMGLEKIAQKIDENFLLNCNLEIEKSVQNFFIGDINCGAKIKLAPASFNQNISSYNAIQKDLPSNLWVNYGNGNIKIMKTNEGVEVTVSTGVIVAFKDKDLTLEFAINLTPCNELKSNNMLGLRIGEAKMFRDYAQAIKSSKSANMDYLIISPGIKYYKYLNYPLEDADGLLAIVSNARNNNLSVGIRYGLRSISSKNTITKVFNGFSNELLLKGTDNENISPSDNPLGLNFIVDVEADKNKKYKDEQWLLRPQSRVNNYYIESLAFLQNALNLRCISMKNPSIDSVTMERAKKTLTKSKKNQGVIELELTNQFNNENAFSSALCLYTEVLPYIDKLWYSDKLKLSYDIYALLFECSGAPYGVATTFNANTPISLSLLFGGLPKYGVESLSSESVNHFYKSISKYDFVNSKFYGFWDEENPIRIDNNNVHASCFANDGNLLISVFNYSNKKVKFELGVETKFGFSVANKKVFAPFLGIEQEEKSIDITKPLTLGPYDGIVFFAVEGFKLFRKKIKN